MLSPIKKILTAALLFTALPILAETPITQAGTLLNLMNGLYTGSTSFAEVAHNNDFGLGTNNGLGGELIILDNKYYLADENGNVKELPLSDKTPFAIVTKFKPQQQFTLQNINSLTQLEQEINKRLTSKNLFYAIKVEGEFSMIKARSVKPPTPPYLPLEKLIQKNQQIFDMNNLQASLIMFKLPEFISPVSVPNYHSHFISADHKKGGHIFDIKIAKAKVSVMESNRFELLLPSSKEYLEADLQAVSDSAIQASENHRVVPKMIFCF